VTDITPQRDIVLMLAVGFCNADEEAFLAMNLNRCLNHEDFALVAPLGWDMPSGS
jgi:hypothetical protein